MLYARGNKAGFACVVIAERDRAVGDLRTGADRSCIVGLYRRVGRAPDVPNLRASSAWIDFSCKACAIVKEMKCCECPCGAVKSAPGEHSLIKK
jgi:hypothetical protein